VSPSRRRTRLDASMPLKFGADRHVMLGQVTYGDFESPEFKSNLSNIYSTFMLKKRGYADEHEVRLVCDMFENGDEAKGIKVAIDLATLIEQVVVAPYAPDGLLAVVQRQVTWRGLRMVPVGRSKLLDVHDVY
jgi:hypothetical protein